MYKRQSRSRRSSLAGSPGVSQVQLFIRKKTAQFAEVLSFTQARQGAESAHWPYSSKCEAFGLAFSLACQGT